MTAKDYIPRRDADFNIMQNNVYKDASENAAVWLIPQAAIDIIDKLRLRWNSAYAAYCDPAKRTKSITQEKNDARKAYVSALRGFIQGQIMHNFKIDDGDRLGMGLPVYDRTPTPAAPPATRPEIDIDFSQISRHVLHVRDSQTRSAGKPPHTIGFEVRRHLGKNQPDYAEMLVVDLAIRSPYMLVYTTDVRTQMAWYAVRWVNTHGEKGPWSEIISAVIA
jgi:hypothetical protein